MHEASKKHRNCSYRKKPQLLVALEQITLLDKQSNQTHTIKMMSLLVLLAREKPSSLYTKLGDKPQKLLFL
jgi:hypothetical protein